MKSIRIRFAMYFAVGLFLFLIYFLIMVMVLLRIINPSTTTTLLYDVNFSGDYLSNIIIFLFCFLTGGMLFSFLLVQPLSQIMDAIGELSKGNYNKTTDVFFKNGRLKWYCFLYKEIIAQIKALENTLRDNSIERKKMENTKNDWLAGVSHDLKTPLSYINGYSSLILNESYSFREEEIKAYIKEIYSKGIYIGKLIDDLNFNFSIDASGNLQLKYSQTEMISFLQNILAGAANEPKSENYIFEFQADMEQINLVIDEELMYRAIYNLLMNCVDHNPSGTQINVELKQEGSRVCIDIRDNGVGMDNEMAVHAFDKYYSGENRQKQGKGLGMFVSKQIIEAHQGSISISSTLGKGTSINIIFH